MVVPTERYVRQSAIARFLLRTHVRHWNSLLPAVAQSSYLHCITLTNAIKIYGWQRYAVAIHHGVATSRQYLFSVSSSSPQLWPDFHDWWLKRRDSNTRLSGLLSKKRKFVDPICNSTRSMLYQFKERHRSTWRPPWLKQHLNAELPPRKMHF